MKCMECHGTGKAYNVDPNSPGEKDCFHCCGIGSISWSGIHQMKLRIAELEAENEKMKKQVSDLDVTIEYIENDEGR